MGKLGRSATMIVTTLVKFGWLGYDRRGVPGVVKKALMGLTVSALLVAAAPAQAVNTPTNVVATNSGTGMGTNTVTWDLNPACSHPAPSNCTDGTVYTGLYRKARIPSNTPYYLLALGAYSYFNDPSGSPTRNRFVDTDLGLNGQRYTYFVLNVDANWIAGNAAYSNSVDAGNIPPYDPDYVVNQPIPANQSLDAKDDASGGGSETAGNNDPDELFAKIFAHDTASLPGTDLFFETKNEVPTVNRGTGTTWDTTGISGSLTANTFGGPSSLLFPADDTNQSSGMDKPTVIYDPATKKELRVWQATHTGTSISGTAGGIFCYANDESTTCQAGENLGAAIDGGGTGDGMSPGNGLITEEDIDQVLAGGDIRHEIRIALGSNLLCPDGPDAGTDVDFRIPARKGEPSASGGSNCLEMGSIVRFVSGVNCNRVVPNDPEGEKVLEAICRAGRDYGFRVSDGTCTNCILVYAENEYSADYVNKIGPKCGSPGFESWRYIVRYNRGSCTDSTASGGLPHTEADLAYVAAPAAHNHW
jgi:hypothetical protein